MLTFFLKTSYLRIFKSGLLLDFFFKRYIYNGMYLVFYSFAILFSEKYFIERLFFKTTKFLGVVNLVTNYFTTEFSYVFLSLIIIVGVVITILTLLNNESTLWRVVSAILLFE